MFLKEVKPTNLVMTQPGLHLVKVDSNVARDWLRFNEKNRRIRGRLVEYLRIQIQSGEWQENHPQPIVFSDAGRLIDGQHRLTAIAEAEVYNGSSVKMRVETGAKDSVREYLDTGTPRALEDRVKLDDDLYLNKFASQILKAQVVLYGNCKRSSPKEAKEFFGNHGDAVKRVYETHRKEKGTGQITVALAAMEYFEIDPEKADEFYSDLFMAAGNIQQSQMLRDYLLKIRVISGGRALRKEMYDKAVGCMKAHMQGRRVTRVVRVSSW